MKIFKRFLLDLTKIEIQKVNNKEISKTLFYDEDTETYYQGNMNLVIMDDGLECYVLSQMIPLE